LRRLRREAAVNVKDHGTHYKRKLELKSNLSVAIKFLSVFISFYFGAESQTFGQVWVMSD